MRALLISLVATFAVACGQTESSLSATFVLDGATRDGQPATRDAGGARDAAAHTDGEVCVDVELSTADLACTEDSDCSFVGATGMVCTTYCCGGGVPANVAAAARVQAEEANVIAAVCPGGCPAGPRPHCANGTCSSCPPSFEPGPPGCVDASAPDGSTCINIDATFPGTCEKPSDCVAVQLGTVCSTTCSCQANTAIPAASLGSYQSELSGITLATCHCTPTLATCASGQCILCPTPGTPNPPAGCD